MIVGSNLHGPFPEEAEEALWQEWVTSEGPKTATVPTEPAAWARSVQTNLVEDIGEESK